MHNGPSSECTASSPPLPLPAAMSSTHHEIELEGSGWRVRRRCWRSRHDDAKLG
jgi:hypothetical protein